MKTPYNYKLGETPSKKELEFKDNLLTETNIPYDLYFKIISNEKLNVTVAIKSSFPEEIYSRDFLIDDLKISKETKNILSLYESLQTMLLFFDESVNGKKFEIHLIDENSYVEMSFNSPLPLMEGPLLIIPKIESDDEMLINFLIEEIKKLKENEKNYEEIIKELNEKVKKMEQEINILKNNKKK
jgi:hypothetical protein